MKLKIGVIGGGEYGEIHLNTYAQLERVGRVKLAAVAARTEKTVSRIKQKFNINGYTDYRQMLAKEHMDAVAVVTPDSLHREMVLEAAKKGIHVLVEKPMDITTAGCLEMIAAAAKAEILLQVDFHKRFDPHIKAVKNAIKNNEIGKIQYGYACMEYVLITSIPNIAVWIENTSPSWLLGIHFYDVLNWLCEDDPVRVYATASRRRLKSEGKDVEDSIQAKIEYAGGANFSFDTCWILPKNFENRVNQELRVIGDDGIIEADLQDRGIRITSSQKPSVTLNPDYLLVSDTIMGQKWSGYAVDSITNFIENVEYIKSGGAIENIAGTYASGVDGLKATAIAQAVDQSIKQHLPIEIIKCW